MPTRTPPSSLTPPHSSTRLGDERSTGFGTTVFEAAAAAPLQPRLTNHSVFDVCHVGVLVRALLFVHAVVAVGVWFEAVDLQDGLSRLTTGSSAAFPGVLLWLLVACGLKRFLGDLPRAAQWLFALSLGALAGVVGSVPGWIFNAGTQRSTPWLALALAGALMAGVMLQWLRMRGQATLPAETKARLAELQSRIRPHFLFNTLNSALALIRSDPVRAESLLEDLAELFRVAITNTGEAVALSDEIELAQRYIAIEQTRFGARLQVNWEIDPAAGSARVPPLLLQPLVENAVRHGVEPADDGGVLRVRTRVRNGRAQISIVNTLPAQAATTHGHGMALRNVRERLRLMHDVAVQFEARRQGHVFRVEITVPL